VRRQIAEEGIAEEGIAEEGIAEEGMDKRAPSDGSSHKPSSTQQRRRRLVADWERGSTAPVVGWLGAR
jgi:hypothetical protein